VAQIDDKTATKEK